MSKPLTEPQQRVIDIMRSQPRSYGWAPGVLARQLWPDSKGWQKRSRRGSTPAGGALGATMPMKAASMLWRMRGLGLVYEENGLWYYIGGGAR